MERSGILAKIFFNNERVLLTGSKTIRLDKYQEELINEMEEKLLELRDEPGRPRPHVMIHGPPGTHIHTVYYTVRLKDIHRI